MIESSILESEWVEPRTDGDGWGYQLKPGAPESVKREFEQFQYNLEHHRKTDRQ